MSNQGNALTPSNAREVSRSSNQTNDLISASAMTVDVDVERPKNEIDRARGQAAKLVAICVTAYPNSDKYQTEQAVINAVNLWTTYFIDDDWRIVGLAVAKHVATSKWPPAIAEIREIMTEIQNPDLIPPDEAWEAVSKLMQMHPERLYSRTESYLPQTIAEAVDAVGYGTLWTLHCAAARGRDSKAGLDRVAFIQAYEPKYQRARQNAQLPRGLRQGITMTQEALSTGDRAMLEDLSRSCEEKRQRDERIWHSNIMRFHDKDPDDHTAALEERQMLALEARRAENGGDDYE